MRIKYIIVPLATLFLFGNVSAQRMDQTSAIFRPINQAMEKMKQSMPNLSSEIQGAVTELTL